MGRPRCCGSERLPYDVLLIPVADCRICHNAFDGDQLQRAVREFSVAKRLARVHVPRGGGGTGLHPCLGQGRRRAKPRGLSRDICLSVSERDTRRAAALGTDPGGQDIQRTVVGHAADRWCASPLRLRREPVVPLLRVRRWGLAPGSMDRLFGRDVSALRHVGPTPVCLSAPVAAPGASTGETSGTVL